MDEGKDEGIDEEHNRQERETEAADLQFQKEMEVSTRTVYTPLYSGQHCPL